MWARRHAPFVLFGTAERAPIHVLRTPDARFADLPDFSFEPHDVDIDGSLRMHSVDEGPRDGRVVLTLHGEPSWWFLYRKMIPIFGRAGFRAMAPDLIGFGRSAKPARESDYTYARHVAWVRRFLDALDLRGITLVAQGRGSLIGLRLAGENDERFALDRDRQRTLFGNNDPILGLGDEPLQRQVPGAKGQPHERFWGDHFA